MLAPTQALAVIQRGTQYRRLSDLHAEEFAGAHGLLRRLLRSPEALHSESTFTSRNPPIRFFTASAYILIVFSAWRGNSLLISVAYGIKVLPENDLYIALAEQALKSGAEANVPGRFLLWVPDQLNALLVGSSASKFPVRALRKA